MMVTTMYVVHLAVILIWWFGKSHKDHQIHYQVIYTAKMGFFHTALKSTNYNLLLWCIYVVRHFIIVYK